MFTTTSNCPPTLWSLACHEDHHCRNMVCLQCQRRPVCSIKKDGIAEYLQKRFVQPDTHVERAHLQMISVKKATINNKNSWEECNTVSSHVRADASLKSWLDYFSTRFRSTTEALSKSGMRSTKLPCCIAKSHTFANGRKFLHRSPILYFHLSRILAHCNLHRPEYSAHDVKRRLCLPATLLWHHAPVLSEEWYVFYLICKPDVDFDGFQPTVRYSVYIICTPGSPPQQICISSPMTFMENVFIMHRSLWRFQGLNIRAPWVARAGTHASCLVLAWWPDEVLLVVACFFLCSVQGDVSLPELLMTQYGYTWVSGDFNRWRKSIISVGILPVNRSHQN